MGIAACLIVLKIQKYLNRAVHQMALLTNVLAQARYRLFLFAIVFCCVLYASAACFTIILGPKMVEFVNVTRSMITLVRALFGDFDFLRIVDYCGTNLYPAVLFMIFLFVSVFIFLSCFFAILAVAQDQAALKMEDDANEIAPTRIVLMKKWNWVVEWMDEVTMGGLRRRTHAPSSKVEVDSGDSSTVPISAEHLHSAMSGLSDEEQGKARPQKLMKDALQHLKLTIPHQWTSEGQVGVREREREDEFVKAQLEAMLESCQKKIEEEALETEGWAMGSPGSPGSPGSVGSPGSAGGQASQASSQSSQSPLPSSSQLPAGSPPPRAPSLKQGGGLDGDETEAEAAMITPKPIKRDHTFVMRWITHHPAHPVTKLISISQRRDVQLLLYMLFVGCFQSMLGSLTDYASYRMTKQLSDEHIFNTFDSAQYSLMRISRAKDFWDWGTGAFIPGVFSNEAAAGEHWVDGNGPFSEIGATPYSVADLRMQGAQLFPLGGIQLRQIRRTPTKYGNGVETVTHQDAYTTSPYGHLPAVDVSHPSALTAEKAAHKRGNSSFVWWTHEQLGTLSDLELGNADLTVTSFPASGYAAYCLPFFSRVNLPTMEAPANEVMAASTEAVKLANSSVYSESKTAETGETWYYCIRTTVNGVWVKQACSDSNANGADGDLVKGYALKWWDELAQMRWIDPLTHIVSLTGNFLSENARMEATIKFQFEFTIGDEVIPSFDVVTVPSNRKRSPMLITPESQYLPQNRTYQFKSLWTTRVLCNFCYAFMSYFLLVEFIQLVVHGVLKYFHDPWNCVDVANISLFWMSMAKLEVSW
jgi:hypothetical protein